MHNLDDEVQTEQLLGIKEMVLPIFAGILSALRRLKKSLLLIVPFLCFQNQLKRRLNAITIASATCFLFPVAMWDMIIITHGFLFSKAFNGSWRMHNRHGDRVQYGLFSSRLPNLLLNFGLWQMVGHQK
ncbi:hypothetical protein Prudu_006604 [Prunus dulcis]|uniref:Uncharacterized protein n=1 Tax=Prunus dulcis TaxID=3755 RepID=A0A4Y1R053_PRUDU|nr:hypothetical protein Prudu_006604 [Prunus dulcis]